MLFQPGVIGRTLHGEIECDLHVEPCRRNELAEIVQRAQFRMHRIVAAFGRADGVGAAGIAAAAATALLRPLRCVADRVDRRETDHVKSHRRDIRQPRDAILEGAVLTWSCPAARSISYQAPAVPAAGPPPAETICDRVKVGPELAFGHRGLQFVGQQRRGVAGLKIILALPQDDGSRRAPRRPALSSTCPRPRSHRG